jgi:hypothetical protein
MYYNTNVMIKTYFSDETYKLPNSNHHKLLALDRSIAGHDVSVLRVIQNILKTFFFLSTVRSKMTQKGQYGKLTANELQMAVAAYRNEVYGLNGYSRAYGVTKAIIRRLIMKKNWYTNGVKALGGQATFSGDMVQILADHISC